MSNFDIAVDQVLKHEGGFVNNPRDLGKATNYGITQKTYESYLNRTVTENDMRYMPKGNAIVIYKDWYWDKVRGDEIKSYPIAFAIFDQAVNKGPQKAIMQAQEALGIYPDGVIDNETIKRLNRVLERNFLDSYIAIAERNYRSIVDINPSQAEFLSGWIKRLISLRKYTDQFVSDGSSKFKNALVWSGSLATIGTLGFMYYKFILEGLGPRRRITI